MRTAHEISEELKAKTNELRDLLQDKNVFQGLKEEDFKKEYVNRQREIDRLREEKENAEAVAAVVRYNKEQKEKRDILKALLDSERPKEDITNQDATLHASKVKKYPKLQELNTNLHWLRLYRNEAGDWKEAETGGKNYRLLHQEYSSSGTTFREFENFEEACRHNGIEVKDLSPKKMLKNIETLRKESEKVRKMLDKYNEKRKSLKGYTLQSIGAIRESQRHYSEYL